MKNFGSGNSPIKLCQVDKLPGNISIQLKEQTSFKQWYTNKFEPLLINLAPLKVDSSIFPDCPKLAQVFDFIEANYPQPITLGDVAKAVGYSRAYLSDLVSRKSGKTVMQWITERRITEACSLLLSTDQTIEEIALAIGYSDVRYFFRLFRKYYKTTPQVWRKAQRAASNPNSPI